MRIEWTASLNNGGAGAKFEASEDIFDIGFVERLAAISDGEGIVEEFRGAIGWSRSLLYTPIFLIYVRRCPGHLSLLCRNFDTRRSVRSSFLREGTCEV